MITFTREMFLKMRKRFLYLVSINMVLFEVSHTEISIITPIRQRRRKGGEGEEHIHGNKLFSALGLCVCKKNPQFITPTFGCIDACIRERHPGITSR